MTYTESDLKRDPTLDEMRDSIEPLIEDLGAAADDADIVAAVADSAADAAKPDRRRNSLATPRDLRA